MPLLSGRSSWPGPIGRRLLVTLSLTVMGLALSVSVASAAPRVPQLGGTYPSSPGVSTTPRIFGWVGEVVTARFDRPRDLVRTAGTGEESTISIYAGSDCEGIAVATGGAAELENSGIQVTVATGSSSTFSATSSDFSGTSACSNPIAYQQVSDPPDSPTVIAVSPPSPADNNLPHILGTAEAGSTVSVYANSNCAGGPVGTGSAELFSTSGIQVAVADNSTSTFYARASWAELPSTCSSTSVTYQELSVPPVGPGEGGGSGSGGGGAPGGTPGEPPSVAGGGPAGPPAPPKLRTVPDGLSNNSAPLVAGSASGAAKVQIYKNAACAGRPVVSGAASQLVAGFTIPVAVNATTKFYAEAVDDAGRTSECSEPVLYTEDSNPPQTRITFGPGVKTAKRTAIFRFADITEDPPGTTFFCMFDRGSWKVCQAPLRLSHLRLRAHTLRVKAVDAAGNEELDGTARRFRVVRVAGL